MKEQRILHADFTHGVEPYFVLERLLGSEDERHEFVSRYKSAEHENVAAFHKGICGRSFEHDFFANWTAYVIDQTRQRFARDGSFSNRDALNLAGTAFNTAESVESVLITMDGKYLSLDEGYLSISPGFPSSVLPSTRFEDLEFDQGHMRILHGTLQHTPLERKAGKLAKLMAVLRGEKAPEGFYDQKTVADMAGYVFDDMKQFE